MLFFDKNKEAFGIYESPIGLIGIFAGEYGITGLKFLESGIEPVSEILENKFINQAKTELSEYFSGKRRNFSVALDPCGTKWQRLVWEKLCDIPYGTVKSYKQIAEECKNPKAYRAVGGANNKNPIGIIIPCHRVIGTNGRLVGYAGGVEKKLELLELERIYVNNKE